MDTEERRRVGARITRARQESGLTQAQLAELLGITTRSVQNYESGAIVPWRHLARIETITHRRRGSLLRDHSPSGLDGAVEALIDAMEKQQDLLREQLLVLRENTGRIRRQLEAIQAQAAE